MPPEGGGPTGGQRAGPASGSRGTLVLLRSRVAPGSAALVLTAIGGLVNSVARLAFSGREFVDHAGYARDLRVLLLELPDDGARAVSGAPPGPTQVAFPHPLRRGLRLEAVGYRYPGGDRDALCDLHAEIAAGSVVALVGSNGAGKSTLAALLLGLYRPTAGGVRRASPPGAGAASAVLQDFVRSTLPVRDHVGFGDLARRDDDAALLAALRQAGSDLQAELDLWLGTDFGGPDLSGGQWLRLALARGMLPAAGLVVLDEPTAAIDPVAEVDIVRRLLAFGRGRTAVVVSHRLGIARAADRILVLEGGRVVEEGGHDALRAAGGLYARMWEAQAAWYRPDAAEQCGCWTGQGAHGPPGR